MAFDIKNIQSPEFLKQLNINELEQLCAEIRNFIIENVSKTGGHLSSNLGVVEATVALHYVFDAPKDKIIFDVGHQCYTHKILTGRAKYFDKLRMKDGLNGFLSYDESEYDCFEAGHSSTSLSAAAGFLEAKEVDPTIGEVIAFIGDGSIQNGLALEGLNYIGSQKPQKAIIILNDNDMSISRNVGRMSVSFSRKRVKKSHENLRKFVPKFVYKMNKSVISAIKTLFYGNDLFTTLGYRYYGPIDGHNLKQLIKYFTYAKKSDTSVVIHLNTIKGKGYKYAEDDINGEWHGTGPFDIETGKQLKQYDNNIEPWGVGIGDALNSILDRYSNVRVLNPAMIVGTFLQNVQSKHKNQVIDTGINEEHSVVMAASMSRNGLLPIVSIYSTFLQRSYDEICHDVCRSDNHVIFLLDHAGIVSGDGSTHQGVFDIPMLLPLPNMVISTASNLGEAKELLEMAVTTNHPFTIRYPKGDIDKTIKNSEKTVFGKWKVLKEISEVNIISYGDTINELNTKLQGKHVGLINAVFVKPIDLDLLNKLKGTKVIIIEEVMKVASLASVIMQANFEYNLNLDIKSYGIDDEYLKVGSRNEIKLELGIDVDSIINKL